MTLTGRGNLGSGKRCPSAAAAERASEVWRHAVYGVDAGSAALLRTERLVA
jgi:hypothetical protein